MVHCADKVSTRHSLAMRKNNSLVAVIMMIAAMFLLPAGDTAGKLLTSVHAAAPAYVAWSRFFIGLLFVLVLLKPANLRLRLFGNWRIWLRSFLVIASINSILTALKTEPIANVFAAFFIGPILSYFISGLLLKESITTLRSALLGTGFIGVLLVVKPNAGISSGMFFAILAGLLYGSFLVANRWLAPLASGKMMLFSQLVIGTLVMTPFGIMNIPTLDWETSWLTLASASCSAAGNLFLILAYQKMEASRLAPLVYTQLISATLFGIVIFGSYPDMLSLIGLALLLSSGISSLLIQPKA